MEGLRDCFASDCAALSALERPIEEVCVARHGGGAQPGISVLCCPRIKEKIDTRHHGGDDGVVARSG